MKDYVYRFTDGTKNVVTVDDALFEILKSMDKAEYCGNRKETRRHVSLDELRKHGIDVPVFDEHTFGELFANLPNEELFESVKNLAAEQKARITYDNILRLVDDPDVIEPIKFLRQREIVHYQRFGDALPQSCKLFA